MSINQNESSIPTVTKDSEATVKPGKPNKTEQLRAFLTRRHGVRISTLCTRLGWQKHTVRAAISRLRKSGAVVTCQTQPKTGEAVYRIDRTPGVSGRPTSTMVITSHSTPPAALASSSK